MYRFKYGVRQLSVVQLVLEGAAFCTTRIDGVIFEASKYQRILAVLLVEADFNVQFQSVGNREQV